MRAAHLMLVALCSVPLCSGCGSSSVPSPFDTESDASRDASQNDASGRDGSLSDVQPESDPGLGKPCVDDGQCDDLIDCTADQCDLSQHRCQHIGDDLKCQNGRYCDGSELCDPQLGCVSGPPVTCSDGTPCTIDHCEEATHGCTHMPRDADGDGDPDYHCTGGADCNDQDPLISSKTPEICSNSRDDNCNGTVDEAPCTTPQYDRCLSPLLLTDGQLALVSMDGTKLDYTASCVSSGAPGLRDIVAALEVPAGQSFDVDVQAQTSSGQVWVATSRQCGDGSTELACGPTIPSGYTSSARLIARQVPAGPLPIYLFSDSYQPVSLSATLRPSQPKPPNETCGTALEITAGQTVTAELLDAQKDLSSNCASMAGELVYSLTVDSPQDLYVFGSMTDGLGTPVLSLRDAGCAQLENELGCQSTPDAALFRRALTPGVYYVSVGATTPGHVQFRVELTAPSTPPADETCSSAQVLTPGQTQAVPLEHHVDDVQSTCLMSAVDAVYQVNLGAKSDVLLVGRLSQGDVGAVSLMRPGCEAQGLLGCANTSPSPVRVSAHGLASGSYRAVIETTQGNPTQLTAFVRPATAPTWVLFADRCEDAQPIGEQGGFFQGNTQNVTAQYPAGCDQAGSSPEGAPEQMLRLELTERRRVLFDMRGSSYRTLLDVRKGPDCPGTELVHGCAAGFYDQKSYLDMTLEPGTYFVQVDGYYGEAGAWFLDVFVSPP